MTQSTTYILGAVAIASLCGYGIYFDHQRRNNSSFRRNLAKQRREAAKHMDAHIQKVRTQNVAAFTLPEEPLPETDGEREAYFMKHLQMGEQLMHHGPPAYDASATCFYRALQVYPEPQKLLEVLSQTVHESILNLIIQKMASDVRRAEANTTGGATIEEVE